MNAFTNSRSAGPHAHSFCDLFLNALIQDTVALTAAML
jgi:hypothetical protein